MLRRSLLLFFVASQIFLLVSIVGCGATGDLNSNPELNLEFGNKLAKLDLWNEAITRWKNGLRLDPDDPRLHNNLAVAYENEGDFEKAEYHYKKALELEPDDRIIQANYRSFKGNMRRLRKDKETEGEQE